MDADLVIASKREVRSYADRPIDEDALHRILEAGRVAGSSRNRQGRRFIVLRDREVVERAAQAVWTPQNLLGAALVVAIVVGGKGPTSFDAGRAAQNMMLAAWNEGIGSSPNGVADKEAMSAAVRHGADEQVAIVLTFGYPARPIDPTTRSPEGWIGRADRLPFGQVVEFR
jgi:nitroreductase